jgi:hypothetical protein
VAPSGAAGTGATAPVTTAPPVVIGPNATTVTPPPNVTGSGGQPGKTDTGPTVHPKPAPTWFVLSVILGLGALGFVFLFYLGAALGRATWSLSDALSEEVPLPVLNGGQPLIVNNEPVLMPQMRASSSRLIALMGLFGILLLYIGFGTFTLYYFGTGHGLPKGLDDIVKFLVAGLTMFAPYLINKFSGIFESLAPKR